MTAEAAELDRLWRDHQRAVVDVAYRLLGSVAEAEDAAQETFLRLARADRDQIENLRGWLVTVVGRICLDELGSARRRREAYVGPWMPEPVVTGPAADPADRVTLDDSVRMAMLVVLERLTPAERVAFVLHDVFQMPFDQVAEVVGRSPGSARQLASRARRRIADERQPRRPVDPNAERTVADRFLAAANEGDLEGLVAVLDPDAELRADSGGLVQGPRRPLQGGDRIAKVMANGARVVPGLRLEPVTVNGGPGAVVRDGEGQPIGVLALTIAGDRVRRLDVLGNPERLSLLRLP